jgi:hypothetical protein
LLYIFGVFRFLLRRCRGGRSGTGYGGRRTFFGIFFDWFRQRRYIINIVRHNEVSLC